MTSLLKTALVAISLAAAGVGASATTASASNVEFGIVIGGGGHHGGPGWNGGHNGGPGWHGGPRDGRHGGYCAPGHALRKANWMGIRHARVVDVNFRTVRVDGRKRGQLVRAVFANDRGCPVVRVR